MSMALPSSYSAAELERLSYRRQFLLDSEEADGLPGWQRQTIAGTYRLLAHPDLELTHVEAGGRSMTLLGYMLDPDAPSALNRDIVETLIRQIGVSTDAAPLTSRLGGRWVLIVHDGRRTMLLHDAAGLRQVYLAARDATGGRRLVCASQPGLIAERLGFQPDAEALDYIRSLGDSDFGAYYLPGDTSPYRQVRALLPNHSLHLEEGRVERYWPTGEAVSVSYEAALQGSLRSLRGFFEAVRHRFPLAVSMTAGWDSRLMLALSHGAARETFYFTITYPYLGRHSRDAVVPATLLQRLGLAHHLIPYPREIDAAFKVIAKRNTASLEGSYCADAQALYDRVPGDRVCVTGDVAEVVKGHFQLPDRTDATVTVADLSSLCLNGTHPFARQALESWLSGVGTHQAIALADLFCWEYMAGRWQAQIRSQYDIVHESFAPLNCRNLLCSMLGLDARYRTAPAFQLFRDIIEDLWKDVLLVPINPPERISLKRRMADAFYHSRIRQLVPPSARAAVKRLLWRDR